MPLFSRKRPFDTRSRALIRQIAAWCLQYPDHGLRTRLDLLGDSASELGDTPAATQLHDIIRYLKETPAREAEQHYVDVFDTRPRRGLHLTWYIDGDTRRRGASLAALAGQYRAHGFRLRDGELPDYLPALLEFTVMADPSASKDGERTLARLRPALRLLHRNLEKIDTVYALPVSAVLATVAPGQEPLPEPPPPEQVGLAPFSLAEKGSP